MPRYVRPAQGPNVEAAIEVLGNRARAALLRFLREHGPATRGEIAEALGMSPSTTYNQLKALAAAGVILSDPPVSAETHGARVKWSVVEPRLVELLGAIVGQYGYELALNDVVNDTPSRDER